MNRKRSSRLRGPSRPVDPRYAPGRPARRGPDTFGMVLVGVSTAVVLLLILYVAALQGQSGGGGGAIGGTGTNANAGGAGQPPGNVGLDPAAAATQTTIAFVTQTAGLPRISVQEAKALHEAGTARFIDVRPPDQYSQQHIKGATNIPYNEVSARLSDIPKSGDVILYCQ